MSTEYGVRCNTCKVDSGCAFNHRPDLAIWLVLKSVEIEALIKSEPSGSLEIGFPGDYDGVVSFALQHSGHNCEVIDEYGRVKRDGKWVRGEEFSAVHSE